MKHRLKLSFIAGYSGVFAADSVPSKKMGFFVTSVGSGKGGDLGGLVGADQHCQDLTKAVGAGGRTWHAYLSTSAVGDMSQINARDRIGNGPWYNAKGVLIPSGVVVGLLDDFVRLG